MAVKFPTKGLYPGETQIPIGTWQDVPKHMDYTVARELSGDFMDHCFRASDKPVEFYWGNTGVKLIMDKDDVFKHLVVYCLTNQDYFAVEPVTNCNNGFNMASEGIDDTGTIYLKPEQELQAKVWFRVESLVR